MEKETRNAEVLLSSLEERKRNYIAQKNMLDCVRRALNNEEARIKRLEERNACTIELFEKMNLNSTPEFREKCERIYYKYELGNIVFDIDNSILNKLRYEVTRVNWTQEMIESEKNIGLNGRKNIDLTFIKRSKV